MKKGVFFERKVNKSSTGTLFSTIPAELAKFLDIEQGDSLVFCGEEKSKGKFLAVWKKEGE